jgi:hypothetical protein
MASYFCRLQRFIFKLISIIFSEIILNDQKCKCTKFQLIRTKFIFCHIDPTLVSMRYPWHENFFVRFCPSSNLAPYFASVRCVESFKSIFWVWRELSCYQADGHDGSKTLDRAKNLRSAIEKYVYLRNSKFFSQVIKYSFLLILLLYFKTNNDVIVLLAVKSWIFNGVKFDM